jgi:hypothetical protein
MNRGRVGEERGSKEMDRYPLTPTHFGILLNFQDATCLDILEDGIPV